MAKIKHGYLNLKYRPKWTAEIIATYRVESKLPLAQAAQKLAAESSIGTWTKLSTLEQKTFNKLAPRIFLINQKKKIIKIAYPLALFEKGSIPQLLSSLAGNIFSMKIVDRLRLLDLELPDKYLNGFMGPAFGIPGVRKILNIKTRPIIGSIIKPKVGLSSAEQAKLAYTIWKNGVDLVKDDENLTDLGFNHFQNRVKLVMALKKKVEKETGLKKIYSFNITGLPDVMLKRAKLVKKLGGKCVMADIVSVGLDNVEYLRKQNLGLIIHGHRAGHSMFTRDKREGMAMLVLAKLARLAGIDQLHTGTVVGKMEGDKKEVTTINALMKEDWYHVNFLRANWSKIKPTLPIASGGLHPALVPKLIKILGPDLIINFGGGLHGHPGGSAAGARACVQAVEATMKKIPLKQYAKIHPELKTALNYWKNK
ncbi:MAG: type III ribulose-bisphosphate carboxylase [Candidatus Komeilibacteria bacterium]|nr:type III ribulose-bisphosphate carboxylase [Candidatus Komeilibacteria bacterium]